MKKEITLNIENQLLSVLRNITGNMYNEIDLTKDLNSQIHLDSLQAVDFFTAIEIEYNIELPLRMMNMKDLNSFIDSLKFEIYKTRTIAS